MKKRLLIILTLVILVVAGVILYEKVILGQLSAQLESQTTEIAQGYQTLITDDLNAVARTNTLNDQQQRILTRINENSSALTTAETLEEKIQNISMIQIALVSFVKTVTADQPFVKDTHFVHLQKEMGERGDMRELLKEYNTTALRWNKTVQSDVGSVTSQIDGSKRNLIPYLRFDGEQEFVTIVEL